MSAKKGYVIIAIPSGCEMELRAESPTINEAHKEARNIKAQNIDARDFQIDIFCENDWKRWEASGFSEDEFSDAIASYGSNCNGKWNEW